MTPTFELDALRRQAIVSSLAGFPILFVFAFAWIAAAARVLERLAAERVPEAS